MDFNKTLVEVTLTADNFKQEVLEAQTPVLVDFWAEWCHPCKLIAPALSSLAKKYQGRLKIGKLNVDEHPQIAVNYQVRGIPNLKIFKNGKIVDELVGVQPQEEIEKRLSRRL